MRQLWRNSLFAILLLACLCQMALAAEAGEEMPAAIAEEAVQAEPVESPAPADAALYGEVLDSGTWGINWMDQVTEWTLYTDGRLIISGAYTMPGFGSEGAPWYRNRTKITSVEIADGVQSIGSYCFEDCSNLVNAIANMTQRYKKALDEVYSSFVYDHPQYFWIRAYGSTGISGETSKISYSWNNDGTYNAVIPAYKRIIYVVSDVYRSNRESLLQQIDDTVSTILEECKRLPTVAKLAHFDSWLAKANAYNYGAANAGADYSAQHPEAWNVIGGLLDGYSPVCEGYAKSFQLLCHKIGVPCITISGGHHMWNMVKVDGNWYYVDCTWECGAYVSKFSQSRKRQSMAH